MYWIPSHQVIQIGDIHKSADCFGEDSMLYNKIGPVNWITFSESRELFENGYFS